MQRRHILIALSAAATALPFAAQAQVIDLNDAINKAGRQRMLSQRMGKAWLALVLGVEPAAAQLALDKSMSLFDRQLVELKAFAPTPGDPRHLRQARSRLERLQDRAGRHRAGQAGRARHAAGRRPRTGAGAPGHGAV